MQHTQHTDTHFVLDLKGCRPVYQLLQLCKREVGPWTTEVKIELHFPIFFSQRICSFFV
jgi:hypothetical protein